MPTPPLTGGEQFDTGGSLLEIATILLVIAGSSIRAVDILIRGLRNRRALIGLRPLWVDLVCLLSPGLDPQAPGRGHLTGP